MPKKSGLVNAREKEIGRRVQIARERINWPQPAFAAELDISRDRLASIEYGRTPLRYPVGYRLCTLFDINPAWLADNTGEMTSNTAIPDLPMPETVAPRALFSGAYDVYHGAKPKVKVKTARAKAAEADLVANFDAMTHVIRSMTDILSREKFSSPAERQEYALEVTSYAQELALRLRRDDTRKRSVPVATRRGAAAGKGDLAGLPSRTAKTVTRLRQGIRQLDSEITRLETAMKSLNPVAITPSWLPRPAAMEAARLEEAMEKIGRQIEEAETKIKALLARRTSA